MASQLLIQLAAGQAIPTFTQVTTENLAQFAIRKNIFNLFKVNIKGVIFISELLVTYNLTIKLIYSIHNNVNTKWQAMDCENNLKELNRSFLLNQPIVKRKHKV